MPKTPSYKLSIKNVNEMGFTLHTVVMKPRECTPLDLDAACRNLQIDNLDSEMPEFLRDLPKFLLTDFFVIAHRTGLYNRQKKLWEALASVAEVRVSKVQQGLFKKIELPIWDFSFVDARGRQLFLSRLLEEQPHPDIDVVSDKGCKAFFANLVQKAEKLKVESPAFAGVFLVCPSAAQEGLKEILVTVTGGTDPIGRYESKLLSAPQCTVDLISYSGHDFSLVWPNLPRSKTVSRASVNDPSEPSDPADLDVTKVEEQI